jgi:hypothetical protein
MRGEGLGGLVVDPYQAVQAEQAMVSRVARCGEHPCGTGPDFHEGVECKIAGISREERRQVVWQFSQRR